VHPELPNGQVVQDHRQPIDVVGIRVSRHNQVNTSSSVIRIDVINESFTIVLETAIYYAHDLVAIPRVRVAETKRDCIAALLSVAHWQ